VKTNKYLFGYTSLSTVIESMYCILKHDLFKMFMP
jgi:hypothetical protein